MKNATNQKAPDERASTPLDLEMVATKPHALEISYPHPATLREPVTQYSPSVTTLLQNLQHIQRTTTGPNHQQLKTYNNKRKRPTDPTPESEATGDDSSPETQQSTGNLKITHASKKTKRSHPNLPPSQQHRQSALPLTIHPVNARPSYTATDMHRTLSHVHMRNI